MNNNQSSEIQKRIINFINRANWFIFVAVSVLSILAMPKDFAVGIIVGGLIVIVNFSLLARTLKKSLRPPNPASYKSVIAKYYMRFIVSGIIIFALIAGNFVNPFGLIIGLSVVVISIIMTALKEAMKIVFHRQTV